MVVLDIVGGIFEHRQYLQTLKMSSFALPNIVVVPLD